ncbi:alpha/beta fold hydrolase [uncultured Paraglaciecola sp.]|uniref:alpha/beta hydrolase family protein n=1 Tax=uncultured Paraglaciecola sp. TaxID=1765024 RepID=UPI00262B2B4C|nr:alpha/beta fold hydrolase [uncultured Paraglaciecola sp.]
MQAVTLKTTDKTQIQGYWFTPNHSDNMLIKGKIVIASAMGVSQRYYQPVAKWLTEQGFCVLTFDCNGMGESKDRHLKEYQCDILDWVKQDYSAALKFVINQDCGAPIYWLGHSLGGQVFPLVENIQKVNKVITVSSGTGYWKRNAPALRNKAPLLWYFLLPLTTALLGYFPGKKLGIVGDMPKQVMLQWRRWCLHPDYCVGVESESVKEKFLTIDIPLVSITFSDDEMLSATNMQDLHALFGHQNKAIKNYHPQDMGEKRIGHLGFFREKFKENLWPKLLLNELNFKS